MFRQACLPLGLEGFPSLCVELCRPSPLCRSMLCVLCCVWRGLTLQLLFMSRHRLEHPKRRFLASSCSRASRVAWEAALWEGNSAPPGSPSVTLLPYVPASPCAFLNWSLYLFISVTHLAVQDLFFLNQETLLSCHVEPCFVYGAYRDLAGAVGPASLETTGCHARPLPCAPGHLGCFSGSQL